MPAQPGKLEENRIATDTQPDRREAAYPIDLSSLFPLPSLEGNAPGKAPQPGPITVAQSALVCWNDYLAIHDERQRETFLERARWLVAHETRVDENAGGWPDSYWQSGMDTQGACLSALTQGCAISVLVRAYQFTGEKAFLEAAERAVCTFRRDILDGGVSTPVGEEGIFFEERAVYPAAHTLGGCLFALLGLYDFAALTGDSQVEALIKRGAAALHTLLSEFDRGFWTYTDVLTRRLASPAHLALQAALLEALAGYTGCKHCEAVASRWKSYLARPGSRLHYRLSQQRASFGRALRRRIRAALFPRPQPSRPARACVAITGFPVIGGTRSVLAGMAEVMDDVWQLEYLTQSVGPGAGEYVIHRFGTTKMHPWQFPAAWFYVLAGLRRLVSLLRHGADYQIILPQDGVFTAAYAALAAKLAGVRIVCIDHGNLTLLASREYRKERIESLKTKPWTQLRRLVGRLQFLGYWPSLSLFAHISARFVDHFLIPGVAGDGVEEACKDLGIPTSRITRFASMIDVSRYPVLDGAAKAEARQRHGIAGDAIVIAMVCRLAPEKGIDIALEALSQTLAALSPELSAQVRVIIAGDGPLRAYVEETIHNRDLNDTIALWGEAATDEVISLLGLSDIFLYTSIRGACLSMAILEAMASGCAIVASTLPTANAHMLARGRGITTPPGDAGQASAALVRLLNDPPLRQRMGNLAREYVAVQHSAAQLRRTLLRVTRWPALDEFLNPESGE